MMFGFRRKPRMFGMRRWLALSLLGIGAASMIASRSQKVQECWYNMRYGVPEMMTEFAEDMGKS